MTDTEEAGRIAEALLVPKRTRRAFALALHYNGEPIDVAAERLGLTMDQARGLVVLIKTIPYRPSNGTEGEIFRSKYCDQCEKDRYDSKPCGIYNRTMLYDIDDTKYPEEWIQSVAADWRDANPRCTAYVELGSVPRKTRPRTIRDARQQGLLL